MFRLACVVAMLAGVALAHGGSGRGLPVVPAPGGTTDDSDRPAPPGPRTPGERDRRGPATATENRRPVLHEWTTWWAYHRDLFLGEAMRALGAADGPSNEPRASRQKVRAELIVPLLRAALADGEHEVRNAAAVALGKLGAVEALPDLVAHVSEQGERWFDVREAALYGIGLLGLPESLGVLRTVAGDKDRPVRERGMALVGFSIRPDERNLRDLAGFLRYRDKDTRFRGDAEALNGEEEKRRMAAQLLGFVDDEGIPALLWEVITSPDRYGEGTAGLAVTALARRGDRAWVGDLLGLAHMRSTRWEVRRSVPIALGLLVAREDRANIGHLAGLARDDTDRILTHFAVMALGRIGGPYAADALVALLEEGVLGDMHDRAFLYLALGLAGKDAPKAAEALLEAYRTEGNLYLLAPQALGLGIARCPGAIPLTEERIGRTSAGRVKSEGAGLLACAMLGLGFHGASESAGVIRETLRKYAYPEIRKSAAIALAMVERDAAAGTLVELLRESGSVEEKSAAIQALGLLPSPSRETIDALIAIYRNGSESGPTRAAAIIALGGIGDESTVTFSARLSACYNYFIRCLALDELATYL